MSRVLDIAGQEFGRLTAIEHVGRTSSRDALWRCRCACGGERVTSGKSLRSGFSISCGCAARRPKTHGQNCAQNPSGAYRSWIAMHQRCGNPKAQHYRLYGGRGIKVCERWKSFENFFADLGERPRGLTLDRKDPEGNYEPSNCRWATWSEQRRNQRPKVAV